MNDQGEWAKIKSLAVSENGDTITQTRYYISSLANDARRLLNVVRTHWGIENSVHWVLDAAFGEDNGRVRVGNSAENFSMLRRMALNMLKSESTLKVGGTAKRKRAGWDGEYLLKVIAQ